jgi:hypothetical protein
MTSDPARPAATPPIHDPCPVDSTLPVVVVVLIRVGSSTEFGLTVPRRGVVRALGRQIYSEDRPALGGVGLESTAFSTATVPRDAAADVTIDESGTHSLQTAQSASVNSTGALVNVTNRLSRDVSVTVAQRVDSTHVGDLVVAGTAEGDVATFTLPDGQTRTVDIAVRDDDSLVGETVYFDVNATARGLVVSAPDRSVPVDG